MKSVRQSFSEATGIDMEDVLFDKAYDDWWAWITATHGTDLPPSSRLIRWLLLEWWADHQGEYV